MQTRPTRRLGASPEKTSCDKVERLFDGYRAARQAGKRTYRLMALDKWDAKWRRRLEACRASDAEMDAAAQDLQEALDQALASEQQLLTDTSFLDVYRGPDKWVWIGGVATLGLVVVLGAVLAFWPYLAPLLGMGSKSTAATGAALGDSPWDGVGTNYDPPPALPGEVAPPVSGLLAQPAGQGDFGPASAAWRKLEV